MSNYYSSMGEGIATAIKLLVFAVPPACFAIGLAVGWLVWG